MSSNQTDICNRALIHLGELPIVNISDNVKAARTLRAVYSMVRQNELRAHRWNFSIVRAKLAALANPALPAFYSTAFALPSDCLRVLLVGDRRQELGLIPYRTGLEQLYVIEGGVIYTNIPAPCPLQYVGDVTNEGKFDACFCEAFSAKLAASVCKALTNSTEMIKICAAIYQRAISEATLSNALELPPQGIADSSWVTSRL